MVVTLGATGFMLRVWYDVTPLEKGGIVVLDRHRALEVLRACQLDAGTLLGLRRLAEPGPGGPPMPDLDVISEIARKLESGEMLVFGEARPAFVRAGVKQLPPPDRASAPKPAPPPSTSSPDSPPESPTFAGNSDSSAQAGAAQQAAQSGVPFCEH